MFFQQNIRSIPTLNAQFWSFSIGGLVRQPLILSYADLQALPKQTLRCAIACAGSSGDHPLIGEAVWRGMPMQALLEGIELQPNARYARLHAADGYTTTLTLDQLAQTLLATEMDDAPLPLEHGYPARLIASGLHGYKMPKWVERIELTDTPNGGFWESRGWSQEGTAGVKVAIGSHERAADGAIRFTGKAYAGAHQLTDLSIRIDGGGWMPIPFDEYAAGTLTDWQIDWQPPGTGDYQVAVQASSDHATDQHSLVIRIR